MTQFDDGLLQQPVPRELIMEHSDLADYMDAKNLHSIQVTSLSPELRRALRVPGSLKSKDRVKELGLSTIAKAQLANPVQPR